RVYINGKSEKLKVHLDDINQSFQTKEPLRIGAGGTSRFHGAIDDVRIFNRCLPPDDALVIATPESIDALLAGFAKATPAERAKLGAYFLTDHAPKHIQDAHRLREDLQK